MRLRLAVAAMITIAAGLATRKFTGWPYLGDALYTVLIYLLVLLVRPSLKPLWAALIAIGASWLIEFAQLAGIPPLLQPLLGSTFNAPDLFWYTAGGLAAWLAHEKGRALARPLSTRRQ
ncbi:DUF2809 domain-containing protein [Nonomuraea sp. NPDC050663]|uniref:DUF2809 domain-containing protein n=1 Tax=Nonomuraea sp. NPDC050663 TaxID=3364370 RepID=UPI0037AE02F5